MRTEASSPDPVVSAAAARLERLTGETAMLDAILAQYASAMAAVPCRWPVPRPLVGHYPLLDSDACGCPVCVDWTLRRHELRRAEELVPCDHRYHICDCTTCYFVKRVWLGLKAAENRRDLLIGASFHAKYHSGFGDRVMEWFVGDLKGFTDVNWWALEGGRYPVAWWLKRCESALSPVVSGPVFKGIDLDG